MSRMFTRARIIVMASIAGLAVIGWSAISPAADSGQPAAVKPTPRAGDEPRSASGGPIEFVVDSGFAQGDKAHVGIENAGTRSYIYEVFYPACYNVRFFDSDDREFKIPPGTHCDIISRAAIKPGEKVDLFHWKLDECVKDRWGCVKSEPLPPGTYRLDGKFELRRGDGKPARPSTEITIVEG